MSQLRWTWDAQRIPRHIFPREHLGNGDYQNLLRSMIPTGRPVNGKSNPRVRAQARYVKPTLSDCRTNANKDRGSLATRAHLRCPHRICRRQTMRTKECSISSSTRQPRVQPDLICSDHRSGPQSMPNQQRSTCISSGHRDSPPFRSLHAQYRIRRTGSRSRPAHQRL